MRSTPVRLDLHRRTSLAGLAACLLIAAASTQAHTFCVGSTSAIQMALDAASDGGANDNENNTIQIVVGTYNTADNGNAEFSHSNLTTARVLDINGGYNNDCSSITENPALTILDGGNATRVFASVSVSGDISLRFLTFQNGNTDQAGAGVMMNPNGGDHGPIIFDQNIVRNNHSTSYDGGFFISTGGSNAIQFENNLVVGNSADTDLGAGEIFNNGGSANIINSTFIQNTVTNTPAGTTGGLHVSTSPSTSGTLSNNIIWGNSGYGLKTESVLVDNDYGSDFFSPDPTSIGNVSIDPQFSSATDFHLLPTSPLLGIGTLTPTGGLPSIDIEGHSRKSLDNKVDMGAYERGNEIFKDGYEG